MNSDFQRENLLKILKQNEHLHIIISSIFELEIPDLFVGAGCIAQTVWNHFHGFEPSQYISDIDIAYYDASDRSGEAEARVIDLIHNKYKNFAVKLDVKNQARVHLWYENHFGNKIAPYKSIYDAIDTWPTTATAIGVRKINGVFEIYAPYGLNDLFGLIVRPNKKQITKEIYERKIQRWSRHWAELKIIKWDDET